MEWRFMMKRKYQSTMFLAIGILVTLSGWLCYHRMTDQNDYILWKQHPSSLTRSSYIKKGPYAGDQVIVVAQTASENASWVDEELPDWQNAIYHVDDPSYTLHVPRNKGREAMTYLTFIIDHYHILPEIVVFLHAHKEGWPEGWHTDAQGYDNVNSVRSLRVEYVRQYGYANMRCIWNPGCPVELHPVEKGQGDSLSEQTGRAYGDAWTFIFQTDNSSIPEIVATPCCSQFAVSREQVLKREVSDYVRMRRWLLDTELDDDISGRVMEYMWHVIFGKDPIWCPDLQECWCQQFKRC